MNAAAILVRMVQCVSMLSTSTPVPVWQGMWAPDVKQVSNILLHIIYRAIYVISSTNCAYIMGYIHTRYKINHKIFPNMILEHIIVFRRYKHMTVYKYKECCCYSWFFYTNIL